VRFLSTPLWFLSAFLASGTLDAQNPPPSPSPQPFTLEVSVDVVSVTVVVHDKSGHFVRGLGANDIQVFEDGVPQQVTYFREASGDAKIPLSVVLVLDASGSMNKVMHFLQEAADEFIGKLEDVDKTLVVDFNEAVRGSKDFTGDPQRLEEFIDALEGWGGTSLYDAIEYSLERVKDQAGRKALIVFTDGEDTTSTLSEKQVMDYARSVEATVYTVGIRSDSGLFARSPRGFLKKIATETGGAFFFPEKIGELIRIFAGIADELHNHYLLAYTPKRAPDGTFRTIEVRLKQKDLDVRVRKGYFALKRRRPPGS
jgi:Ca-activated chloride channel family protein